MVPIMNGPTAPYATLRQNAIANGATDWYLHALVALWDAGIATGVDPTVLAAQCAHETGWGKFGGAVTKEHGNTCGLKTRDADGDTPDDHARFAIDPNDLPRVGALAHAHHLRAYCGFPVPGDTPDPRAVWISPSTRWVSYVEDLGGRWAPSPDYGRRVAGIVARLIGGT